MLGLASKITLCATHYSTLIVGHDSFWPGLGSSEANPEQVMGLASPLFNPRGVYRTVDGEQDGGRGVSDLVAGVTDILAADRRTDAGQ